MDKKKDNRNNTLEIQRIVLGRKVDAFKSNWFLYEAILELTNGAEIKGYVQADYTGNLIDEMSFEPEEE